MKFFKKYMLLYNSDMKSRKHSTYPIRLNIQYPPKPDIRYPCFGTRLEIPNIRLNQISGIRVLVRG